MECSVELAGEVYRPDDLFISGNSLAVRARNSLPVGGSYTVSFSNCGITAGSEEVTISERREELVGRRVGVPIPAVLSVSPASNLFAGESYHFVVSFDEPVNAPAPVVVNVQVGGNTVAELPVSIGVKSVEFDFTVPTELSGSLVTVYM
jgi:hypothetical protein